MREPAWQYFREGRASWGVERRLRSARRRSPALLASILSADEVFGTHRQSARRPGWVRSRSRRFLGRRLFRRHPEKGGQRDVAAISFLVWTVYSLLHTYSHPFSPLKGPVMRRTFWSSPEPAWRPSPA